MKILNSIDQIDEAKWQTLVDNSPVASPFQTPSFYHFYNSLSNASADVFAVEENGSYTALAIVTIHKESGLKTFFSRRAMINGGLLLSQPEEPTAAIHLLTHLEVFYRRRMIYVEVRNSFDYASLKSKLDTTRFKYIPWLNFQHHNVNPDTFFSKVSKGRQRQIKKAKAVGVSWCEANSDEELRSFYTILSDLYVNKVKKPLPSFEFFQKLCETEFATCLLVMFENRIVGGVVCPFDSNALYELYICGLDKQYSGIYPSIMAMWAMVEYASQHNIPNLDLMGAGQPNIENTVRTFKSRFGGDLVEHGRFLLVCQPVFYSLGRFYLKLRKLF